MRWFKFLRLSLRPRASLSLIEQQQLVELEEEDARKTDLLAPLEFPAILAVGFLLLIVSGAVFLWLRP